MYIEGDFSRSGFEAIPGYREIADSPFLVVPQTSAVLDLFLNDEIINPDPARQFLNETTFPYLNRAKNGLEIISSFQKERTTFHWQEIVESDIDPQDKEKLEAFGYMNVVFAFMPEIPSDILPNGFSRKGNLRPPETKSQFSDRVEELRLNVFKISQGELKASIPLELMRPSLSRTLAFFRTGSWLPLKFPDAHKERDEFERILGDVDIKLEY